ncbi:MAG: LysR family transcriptional regulator [Mucilaginibacter sp.]|nr:LysR family transcriptional regulator [Mucilaginibacter sp.]
MSLKILNLYKVKILSEVCKTGSYRIASRNLFITPSAVSKAIRSLEIEWKLKLVESSGNSVKVTDEAKQLAVLTASLLQANDELCNRLNELNGASAKNVLRMGSGGSHSKIILNQLLTYWLLSVPALEYEVTTSNSFEVLAQVDKGELDCGVVSGKVPDDVNSILLFKDTISLYGHRTHPLADANLSLNELIYPICLREKGSSTRKYLEDFILENNIKFMRTLQTGKNEELTDHVCQSDDALQFMSDYYYKHSHWKDNYMKIQCNEVAIPISIYFITRKGFPFDELTQLTENYTFQEEILAS